MAGRVAAALALVSLAAVFAGCGGAGSHTVSALAPAQAGAQISLTHAMALPMATNPVAGSQANVRRLQRLQNEARWPDTVAELRAELAFWVSAVTANANDSAAQLGLSLTIAACAGQNAAHAVGEDLLPPTNIISVTRAVIGSELRPQQLISDALAAFATGRLPPVRRLAPESSAAPTSQEIGNYRTVIQTSLIPPLEHVQARLTEMADRAPTARKLMTLSIEGTPCTVYGADVRAVGVVFGLARCALLMVSSIDPDYGRYNWDLDLERRDRNRDGKLTVAEYAPPSPFGNITAASWTRAGVVLRVAVAQAQRAESGMTADRRQVLWRALGDTSRAELRRNLADIATMLNGRVSIVVQYDPVWVVYGEEPDAPEERVQDRYGLPCNLRELWDRPPASLRDLLPPLYLSLEYGQYGSFVMQRERVLATSAKYRVSQRWPPYGSRAAFVKTSTAPHRISSGARATFPGISGSFNWNWSRFTGSWGGLVAGRSCQYRSVDAICRWGDLPDKTLSGVFPQPDKLMIPLYGNYDNLVIRYNSIYIVNGESARRAPGVPPPAPSMQARASSRWAAASSGR